MKDLEPSPSQHAFDFSAKGGAGSCLQSPRTVDGTLLSLVLAIALYVHLSRGWQNVERLTPNSHLQVRS